MTVHRHTAFGATWRADVPLDQFDACDGDSADDRDADVIVVRRVSALAKRTSLNEGGTVFADGLRFAWRDEVTFDLWNDERVDYLPGPGWKGTMPVAFSSTVAALTLAWRGALPLHASAIEVAGRAVLIAGFAGAGKSTLTAELLRRGAALIGDDLSVIARASPDAPFAVARGRPGIRLHPDSAARLPAIARLPVAGDDRGKWLVRPVSRSTAEQVPMAGFIMLGAPDGPIPRRAATPLVGNHLFRPRWLRLLPRHAERLRTVLAIADRVPCYGFARTGTFHCDASAIGAACAVVDALANG